MNRFRSLQVVAEPPSAVIAGHDSTATVEAYLVHPDRDRGDDERYSYGVVVHWVSRNGQRAEPARIEIEFGRGELFHSQPVTAAIIREMPLGEMIDAARRELVKAARRAEQWENLGIEPAVDWSKYERTGPRQGSPIPKEQDELVAAEYRRAWSEGHPTGQAVAEKLNVSVSTARKRIMRARNAGLLDGIGPNR